MLYLSYANAGVPAWAAGDSFKYEAGERISGVVADTNRDEVVTQVSADWPREVVTDKAYHNRAVVSELGEWGPAHVLLGTRIGPAAVVRSRAGNNKQRMQIDGAFAESEASGCHGSAARSWNDGINCPEARIGFYSPFVAILAPKSFFRGAP
jgi:hypothetical protein